jgi:hypothetical protein
MIHHSPRFPPPWSVEVVARKEAPLPGLMKVRLHVAQICANSGGSGIVFLVQSSPIRQTSGP